MKSIKHISLLIGMLFLLIGTGCQKMEEITPDVAIDVETRSIKTNTSDINNGDRPNGSVDLRTDEIRVDGDGLDNINDDDDDEDDDEVQSLNRN